MLWSLMPVPCTPLQCHLILHCCQMDWRAAQDVFCKQQLWAPKLQNDIHSREVAPHDRMMQGCSPLSIP